MTRSLYYSNKVIFLCVLRSIFSVLPNFKETHQLTFQSSAFACCHLAMPVELPGICSFSAAWGSHASTSGRHMPGETDVCGVRGQPGPLMQIKEEK